MHARSAYTIQAQIHSATSSHNRTSIVRLKEMKYITMDLHVPGSEYVTPRFTNISRHTSLSRRICSLSSKRAVTAPGSLRPLHFQVFCLNHPASGLSPGMLLSYEKGSVASRSRNLQSTMPIPHHAKKLMHDLQERVDNNNITHVRHAYSGANTHRPTTVSTTVSKDSTSAAGDLDMRIILSPSPSHPKVPAEDGIRVSWAIICICKFDSNQSLLSSP
jgi:hypothetical protein